MKKISAPVLIQTNALARRSPKDLDKRATIIIQHNNGSPAINVDL
jgi:hypothetical protein